jgi:hypothetical protein
MKLSPDMIKSLSKADAQKLVQQKMAEIRELLDDCEAVMDHHRFICDLPTKPTWWQITYLPKDLTDAERGTVYSLDDNGHLHWAGINEHQEGGEWVSSSTFGVC